MADICGPFTLEDLDQFGNLDSLAFSLDDPIWASADTCIFDVSAATSGSASASSVAYRDRYYSASVDGSATADADFIRERYVNASVSGLASTSIDYTRIRPFNASASASASTSISYERQRLSSASLVGLPTSCLALQGFGRLLVTLARRQAYP